MSELNFSGFSGANNVSERFYSRKGIVEPKVILNLDVNADGSLTIRAGKTLFITLPNAHSLWSGNTCMLCVAENVLYRIRNGVATSVGTIAGPRSPVSFVDAEEKVFFSNQYSQGIFDPLNDTVSSWGIALPNGPMLLSSTDGSLTPGTYHICMTNVANGELSGNGTISDIILTATGGIQILNRPSGVLVWASEADEYMFYLVGAVDTVVDIPGIEPLPSFLCSPPPYMENLCYAFGRIWGSCDKSVYYSEPFHLGWFKLSSNKYPFEDEITMIAKAPTGLFIGMKHRTRFLAGTIPEQMAVQDAGAGSVRGTLAYCNQMPELGWTLGTPEKDFTDVPVWLTTEGVVVGAPSGHLFNISKNKIKMSIPDRGASLYRNLEGVIQFLTSFKTGSIASGAGFRDADTYAAIRSGKIDIHEKSNKEMSSRAAFSDEVSCTVTRGGVEI